MKHFRPRASVVEAMQLAYSTTSQDKVIQFMNGTSTYGPDGSVRFPDGRLAVTGDWILKNEATGVFEIKKMVEMSRDYELVKTETEKTNHVVRVIRNEIDEIDSRLAAMEKELHMNPAKARIHVSMQRLKTARDYLEQMGLAISHAKKHH